MSDSVDTVFVPGTLLTWATHTAKFPSFIFIVAMYKGRIHGQYEENRVLAFWSDTQELRDHHFSDVVEAIRLERLTVRAQPPRLERKK